MRYLQHRVEFPADRKLGVESLTAMDVHIRDFMFFELGGRGGGRKRTFILSQEHDLKIFHFTFLNL